MRVQKLEDHFEAMRAFQPQDISADEIAAYQKVRDSLQVSICTPCQVCYPCRICWPCHTCLCPCGKGWKPPGPCLNECTCGPCSQGGLSGMGGRFGNLGG